MHRYVSPLGVFSPFLLLLLLGSPQDTRAANNIGCLFSDTLCEQDREWCFDDQAFGHCLSDYGHYSGDDLHRYELGSEELRVLEQEMQRLFLLGYRWSHTYTQCVLQSLLRSFRSHEEFDISACNKDLDQDLEGALKAIEGEELVDPRDLAIVRFTPSETDPHSAYADEVYFPPIREGHPDTPPGDQHHQDGSSKESLSGVGSDQQQHEREGEALQDGSGTSSSSGSGTTITASTSQNGGQSSPSNSYHYDSATMPKVVNTPHDDNNMADNYIQSYLDDDPDLSNTIYPQHYQPFNKRGYMDQGRTQDFNNYSPGLTSKNIYIPYGRDRDSSSTSSSSSSNRYQEDDNRPFEDQYEDEGGEGVFEEEPTRPMYTEGGMQFMPQVESNRGYLDDGDGLTWSNLPEVFSGYGGGVQDYRSRARDYNLQPNFPGYGGGLRSYPDDYQRYPYQDTGYGDFQGRQSNMRLGNSLSSGYGSMRNPWNVATAQPRNLMGMPDIWEQQSLRTPLFSDNVPWGYRRYSPGQSFPYQAPRSTPAMSSRLMVDEYPNQVPQQQQQQPKDQIMPYKAALEGYEDEETPDYPDYTVDYSDYDQFDQDQFGRQRTFPYNQKFVKKDEETIGSDYGELGALGPWSFQREERQDVKKPGPFFNSKNNYAFGTYDTRFFLDPIRQDIVPLMVPREVQRPWPFLRPLSLWSAGGPFKGLPPPRSLYPLLNLPQSPQALRAQGLAKEGGAEKEEVPDLLLDEEKVVEEAAEEGSQGTGQPQTAEERELKDVKEGEAQEGGDEEEEDEEGGEGGGGGEKTDEDTEGTGDGEGLEEGRKDGGGEEEGKGYSPPSAPLAHRGLPPTDSFVTITTSDNLSGEEEGRRLAVAALAAAGIVDNEIDTLSVEDNRVTFRVPENDLDVTAEDVVRKTVEVKEELKQLGFHVEDAAVEKSTVSAVMFNPSEKNMVTAAVIVCGVMGALVVAAGAIFFVRRHARAKAKLPPYSSQDTEAKDYEDLCRARMAGKGAPTDGSKGDGASSGTAAPSSGQAPSGQRVSSLSRDSDNGNNSPSSRSSTSSCEEPVASNMDISTGHMVLSYMEDHLKNKDRLEQEWIALCAYEADSCATNLALKPENSQKNRYPDAVPYDNNRVVLNAHTNVNGSDYINASPITDHDPRNPTYIATQGPLESTAADFWQLVWEQGSVVVVMLTRLTENGNSLCFRYWPEEGSELYHIYEVHLVSEHIWCDDYLVRSFYLKNVRTGETRTVTQFHFLSWPDSGTPASTKALLEFRRKVNKSYRGRSCPIIVHCSDGIGRTGTYSLIDMVLNRMAKGAKEIDIAATLEHIRDQRPHMVRTKAQFEFVLMAVAEEVHAILKALPQ